jgi:hypothetical protein
VAFYESKVPGLGKAFADEVRAVIDEALTAPQSGIAAEEGTRRKLLARFPFAMIYLPDAQRIADDFDDCGSPWQAKTRVLAWTAPWNEVVE